MNTIKIIKHKIEDNYLEITLESNEINHVIINTIRRVILSLLPTYAFYQKNINISKNTTVTNNDYLKLRISNFPIYNINNKENTIEHLTRLKKNFHNNLNINEFIDDDKNLPELEKITMYCNVKNDNKDLLNITTNMCKFYNDDQEIPNIYKKPLLICKLKPGEEINFTATTELGIGLVDAIWTTTDNVPFEQINDNKFKLKFESDGQLKCLDIINRSIKIIINHLLYYRDILVKELENNKFKGDIIIDNEDHTFGNLISRSLQDHKNIEFAGYKIDHLLVRTVTIKYITNGGKSISNIIMESLSDKIKLYENILSKLK